LSNGRAGDDYLPFDQNLYRQIAITLPTLDQRFLLCAVLALASCSQPAQPNSNVVQSMQQWNQLNSDCRGGSGDNPKTWQACEARDALGAAIEAQGMCYGENAEFGYQANWEICNRMN
jgi:hypothetical protein